MKKIVKFTFLVLMILGIVFSIFNFTASNLHAGCFWVEYHPAIPDCYGRGSTCLDCTAPQIP